MTILFLLLALGAAFVGFRDILPGALSLVARVLFVLLALAGLYCLNRAVLRRPSGPDRPEPGS